MVTFAPKIPTHLLAANPPNYQLGCPAGYLRAVTQTTTAMPPIVPGVLHKGATMSFHKGATREMTDCDDDLIPDSGCNETVTGSLEDFMLPMVGSDDSGMDNALMALFNQFNLTIKAGVGAHLHTSTDVSSFARTMATHSPQNSCGASQTTQVACSQ